MNKKELYFYLLKELEKLKKDEKILSESKLIKISKLSRGSVREVLIKLQIKGFIYVVAKKGYYKKINLKTNLKKEYKRHIITKKIENTKLFNNKNAKTLHISKVKYKEHKIVEYQEIYFNSDFYLNLLEADFTNSIENIIKTYSDTKLISLNAKVKVVPTSKLYKFDSEYNKIMFSNYNYFNEYGEIICLVHSYFSLEEFNINYQKTM